MTTSNMSNYRFGFMHAIRAWISSNDQHLRKKQLFEQNTELLDNQGIPSLAPTCNALSKKKILAAQGKSLKFPRSMGMDRGAQYAPKGRKNELYRGANMRLNTFLRS